MSSACFYKAAILLSHHQLDWEAQHFGLLATGHNCSHTADDIWFGRQRLSFPDQRRFESDVLSRDCDAGSKMRATEQSCAQSRLLEIQIDVQAK
ncbi:hypothetical protein KCU92_g233, partial [Aureobasidium melanogenum]